MLLDVLPASASEAWNIVRRNVELIGNVLRAHAVCKKGANLDDILLRKLRPTARTSSQRHVAPFRAHVANVILGRAKEQVGGVDTRRVIAMMAHKQTLWNRAIVKLIGNAVRRYAGVGVKPETTIPGCIVIASPKPTAIRLFDETPKADFRGNSRPTSALAGELYTVHASASNQVLAKPGLLTQRPDFSCLIITQSLLPPTTPPPGKALVVAGRNGWHDEEGA